MTISARAPGVTFDDDQMWARPGHGRTIGAALAPSPRLLHESVAVREQVEISPGGLHWDALDEDLSIADSLPGRADMARASSRAA